jgi:subtilisin family serine protease
MIAAAFEYARALPADVINCSLGGTAAMPSVQTQMQANYNAGIAMFCASGNSGNNEAMYPAAYSQCLAVGGVKHDDSGRTSITTYGNWLDCCAASGDVSGSTLTEAVWSIYVASVADANADPEVEPGEAMLAGGAGTSFASPYAAGVGALIKALEPAFAPAQVYNQITGHCHDVAPAGYDIQTGYGRIDISAALEDWNQSGVPSAAVTAGVVGFPNPSVCGGTVRFAGAGLGEAQRIEILDIQGRLVRAVDISGGEARWDGITGAGMDAGSGIFFSRMVYQDGTRGDAGKIVRIR